MTGLTDSGALARPERNEATLVLSVAFGLVRRLGDAEGVPVVATEAGLLITVDVELAHLSCETSTVVDWFGLGKSPSRVRPIFETRAVRCCSLASQTGLSDLRFPLPPGRICGRLHTVGLPRR